MEPCKEEDRTSEQSLKDVAQSLQELPEEIRSAAECSKNAAEFCEYVPQMRDASPKDVLPSLQQTDQHADYMELVIGNAVAFVAKRGGLICRTPVMADGLSCLVSICPAIREHLNTLMAVSVMAAFAFVITRCPTCEFTQYMLRCY